MPFHDDEIRQRLRLGEDSYWEFKGIEFSGDRPRRPRRDDLADELAAFANTGGGVMLCGVTDGGEVQGMTRRQVDELEALLVNVCRDSISPPVTPTVERRELDGGMLLLVKVAEGDAQHDSPGGSFHRVGSSKRRMTPDERLRLAQRRGQARFLWFDKQPVPGTGFASLAEKLWRPLLGGPGTADPRLGLEKMGLLGLDDAGVTRATAAGVLLCSESPQDWLPSACITATAYVGADRGSGQIDSQTISGPLNHQVRDAAAFVARNTRVSAVKAPGRVDFPQYSDRAVFEAVVNAVAHRDYSISGSRTRLSMFADRLEIQSPGGLPNNLTVESIGLRQSTRNEVLVSVLGRMRVGETKGAHDREFFMERRGDGVPIILSATEELGADQPRYEVIDGSEVRLTIPAAPQAHSPGDAVVTVFAGNEPLAGVDVAALFPNKTYVTAATGALGEAVLGLHSASLPMTVFAAAPGWSASLVSGWRPEMSKLGLSMRALPAGGSAIFLEGSGEVPGIVGRLNPVRDNLDRTYLYTSNISVNEGSPQPVPFVLGEKLRLVDAHGTRAGIRIIDIVGASALVEYQGEAAGRGGASKDASDPGRRDHGRSSPLTDSG